MSNGLIENLTSHFPFIARDAIGYKEVSPFELTVRLNDGSAVAYDDRLNSIRTLPLNGDKLTEYECRREFGVRLHKMLKRKNISQYELAKRANISQVCISNYINGKTTPSFYNADKIAKALDCSTEDFRYE